jgi:hypothetical protein
MGKGGEGGYVDDECLIQKFEDQSKFGGGLNWLIFKLDDFGKLSLRQFSIDTIEILDEPTQYILHCLTTS